MARLKQIGVDIEIHRVIEGNRLSFSESENDILRRMLLPQTQVGPKLERKKVRATSPRVRGVWKVKMGDELLDAPNLLDAYEQFLRGLAKRFPEFLDRFSMRKGRSRRYIARDPQQLYQSSPHLAKEFARNLVDGWFFDTNLSEQQIATRIREAVECAGVRYGTDASISEDGRII